MPQVRVIGSDGSQLGVMHPRDAMRIAQSEGLDLVEVATNATPPVCRIIDYGKYQYEAKKKAHEAKKNQVVITVKEIKFRPGTDDHDYDYRIKHARDWLMEGNKVRATIFFRGREMTHRELGSRILAKVEKELSDIAETEVRPKMEGNQMFIIMTPKRQKIANAKAEAKPKPVVPVAPPAEKPLVSAPPPAEVREEPAQAESAQPVSENI